MVISHEMPMQALQYYLFANLHNALVFSKLTQLQDTLTEPHAYLDVTCRDPKPD